MAEGKWGIGGGRMLKVHVWGVWRVIRLSLSDEGSARIRSRWPRSELGASGEMEDPARKFVTPEFTSR